MSDEKININVGNTKLDTSRMDFEGLGESLSSLINTINQLITTEINKVSNLTRRVGEIISQMISSDYMRSFKESFASFTQAIIEAQNNPNSYINFHDYQEKLNTFHWAWPFKITPEELKILIEQAENEVQFDKLLASFFSIERVNDLCKHISNGLPRRHKLIFRQIENAYANKQYALVNNAATSVLDNLLISVLKNKGCVTRQGILHPIIEFYADNYTFGDVDFLFELQMLSNNINLIFDNYNFGEKIIVDSNKKVRRHLSTHGFMYSNRKIDTIMILNTIAALISSIPYIQPFYKTIERKNKSFIIGSKNYVINNRVKKILAIQPSN